MKITKKDLKRMKGQRIIQIYVKPDKEKTEEIQWKVIKVNIKK